MLQVFRKFFQSPNRVFSRLTAVATLSILISLIGCSIFWSYKVQLTRGEIVADDHVNNLESETQSRVHAYMDNGVIRLKLELTNITISTLDMTDVVASVKDTNGKRLEVAHRYDSESSCQHSEPDKRVLLKHNESCQITEDFATIPMVNTAFGWWSKPNPELRDLVIHIEGLRRNDRPSNLNIKIHWSLSS